MQPKLIHPIPITVERLNRSELVMDADTREPMHGARAASSDVVLIDAQIKWGAKAQPAYEAGGVEEKSEGYILCRLTDLTAKGGIFKRGDRITSMGAGQALLPVDLYVTKTEPTGHWPDQGGFTLMKFYFMDRKPVQQVGDL